MTQLIIDRSVDIDPSEVTYNTLRPARMSFKTMILDWKSQFHMYKKERLGVFTVMSFMLLRIIQRIQTLLQY